MTETHTTTADGAPVFPPGRYGRRRSGRRRRPWMMALMACVVVAASLLVATRLYRQYGDPAYDADVIAYTEITDAQVLIRFQVNVPSGRSATCVLRARARDGSEVGKDEVLVTAKPGEKLVVTEHRLPTTARPLVGEVLRCRDANT